ncbi:hypothetical protein E2C01_094213 [Portunus trituberculatus]|uniref:Uncharacterized protein n=1 Tax=Portunus trituberculatus TaxID=210409 RepID=A0A5B7K100_PORTR|nr:hypothetical protein [Portunus trituberculatus]
MSRHCGIVLNSLHLRLSSTQGLHLLSSFSSSSFSSSSYAPPHPSSLFTSQPVPSLTLPNTPLYLSCQGVLDHTSPTRVLRSISCPPRLPPPSLPTQSQSTHSVTGSLLRLKRAPVLLRINK